MLKKIAFTFILSLTAGLVACQKSNSDSNGFAGTWFVNEQLSAVDNKKVAPADPMAFRISDSGIVEEASVENIGGVQKIKFEKVGTVADAELGKKAKFTPDSQLGVTQVEMKRTSQDELQIISRIQNKAAFMTYFASRISEDRLQEKMVQATPEPNCMTSCDASGLNCKTVCDGNAVVKK
jgi:hypothetical protein